MARIRSIKPEFPQSESMGNVSREARLTFIMLWTLADDEGRLRGNSRMLASLLFPYDNDAGDLIDDWLLELEREGCIVRYKNGKDSYMQLCNWLIHQKIDKPSKSKIAPFAESSRILANARGGIKDQGEDQGRDQGEEARDKTVVVDPSEDAPEIAAGALADLQVPNSAPLPVRNSPPVSDDPAVVLTVELRRLGVNVMSTNPYLIAWVRDAVPLSMLAEAVALAREHKGDAPIPPAYLVPIVQKLRNPPAARQSSARAQSAPNEKFNFGHLDRSGDVKAMEASMKRHGVVVPVGDEEIEI
ncbi:hypothetical protein [Duganella sp. LjRoot269]|uniref:hypothetical protein n=1 Tax=Duganella sp. LjRoot269 TaxID=3342305 RepID=UPI003ECD90DF